MSRDPLPPILDHDPGEASVFLAARMMESARRQKGLARQRVPAGCVLDFDGELVDHLLASGRARPDADWPCFHTRLHRWTCDDREIGIIGGTVGAPYAVLVAEELFAAGCEALVSIGSAGLLRSDLAPPFFLLIERSLRDEGTSYHYLAPAPWIDADRETLARVEARLGRTELGVCRGPSWTTDAPFRETASRIDAHRRQGIVAVEMEAAALLSFAASSQRRVVCFSHVTNQMATGQGDFEKGGADGHEQAIRLCEESLSALLQDASAPAG